MNIKVFGDVLLESNYNYDYTTLVKILKLPKIKPRYRISVLYPDETIASIIPSEDIPINGISFTENYQQGQRKNLTVTLINKDKKYTPSVNSLWVNDKFKLDIGIELLTGEIVWFPKGIYILGNVSLTNGNSDKTIELTLKDKFALFEDKTGTLETAYEIPVGSDILDAINGILNFDKGDGYIMDYKPIILDSSFTGFKTQATIRKEAGDNLGAVLLELAIQLSAEIYYNNVGNLSLIPLNETIDDSQKPIIWTYTNWDRDIHNLNLNYQNDEIINVIKVVGDNSDYGIFSSVVTNENIKSPLCIQQIGRRINPPYNEANVWSDEIAENLAKYYLRQKSFLQVQFSAPVSFNPILTVNNLCEIEDSFLGLERERLLITSINFTSDTGEMSLSLANTNDLPSL